MMFEIGNNDIPLGVSVFSVVPSSSRLTLSRDAFDRRCEVRRGDFGGGLSSFSVGGSSFVSVAGVSGMLAIECGSVEESLLALSPEEERRLVNDRVLTTVAICADSIAAMSLASSKLSYRRKTILVKPWWHWHAGAANSPFATHLGTYIVPIGQRRGNA
jgi:hypothetical protein